MQETNVSISQFHRIRSPFVGCRLILCIFISRTFVTVSWMCKKQTSVSHSLTESEVSSLDAGLRMDRAPALDLVIEVLHSSRNIQASRNRSRNETQSIHTNPNTKTKIHSNREVDEFHVITSSQTQNGTFRTQWSLPLKRARRTSC